MIEASTKSEGIATLRAALRAGPNRNSPALLIWPPYRHDIPARKDVDRVADANPQISADFSPNLDRQLVSIRGGFGEDPRSHLTEFALYQVAHDRFAGP